METDISNDYSHFQTGEEEEGMNKEDLVMVIPAKRRPAPERPVRRKANSLEYLCVPLKMNATNAHRR